jgi:hypothetical protein
MVIGQLYSQLEGLLIEYIGANWEGVISQGFPLIKPIMKRGCFIQDGNQTR